MISAGIWVALGLLIAVVGSRMGLGTWAAPGSGFLPTLSGVALAVLGTLVLFGEWQAGRVSRGPAAGLSGVGAWRIGATTIALFVYGLLLNTLGFVVTTLLVLGFVFRFVTGLGWFATLVASSAATAFSYMLFAVWLKVPFPSGLWAP